MSSSEQRRRPANVVDEQCRALLFFCLSPKSFLLGFSILGSCVRQTWLKTRRRSVWDFGSWLRSSFKFFAARLARSMSIWRAGVAKQQRHCCIAWMGLLGLALAVCFLAGAEENSCCSRDRCCSQCDRANAAGSEACWRKEEPDKTNHWLPSWMPLDRLLAVNLWLRIWAKRVDA